MELPPAKRHATTPARPKVTKQHDTSGIRSGFSRPILSSTTKASLESKNYRYDTYSVERTRGTPRRLQKNNALCLQISLRARLCLATASVWKPAPAPPPPRTTPCLYLNLVEKSRNTLAYCRHQLASATYRNALHRTAPGLGSAGPSPGT